MNIVISSFYSFLLLAAAIPTLSQATQSADVTALFKSIPFASTTKTGSVQVPLDWSQPQTENQASLEISYKMWNPQDTHKPLLFLVGGGPGMASISNYDANLAAKGSYSEYYRIVVFDQRGVGLSSPLKNNPTELNPAVVMKYFGQASHAKDLQRLIKTLNKNNDVFYVMGHSYGGLVVENYISQLTEKSPKPHGVFLVSPGSSTIDAKYFLHSRFQKQLELNQELARQHPEIVEKIKSLRQKISNSSLQNQEGGRVDVNYINAYSSSLDNPQYLEQVIDRHLEAEAQEVLKQWMLSFREYYMNHIGDALSAAEITSPYSISEMIQEWVDDNAQHIEEWMLLEALTLQALYNTSNEQEKQYSYTVEKRAKKLSVKPDYLKLKKSLQEIPLLVMAADDDHYIPFNALRQEYEKLMTQAFHHFEPIIGGNHYSGLQSLVAEPAHQKMNELVALNTNSCVEVLKN